MKKKATASLLVTAEYFIILGCNVTILMQHYVNVLLYHIRMYILIVILLVVYPVPAITYGLRLTLIVHTVYFKTIWGLMV